MESVWHKRLMVSGLVLALLLAGYSLFFRTYLDADRYLAMALEATGDDPTIINADEPDFSVGFHEGRLTIHLFSRRRPSRGLVRSASTSIPSEKPLLMSNGATITQACPEKENTQHAIDSRKSPL
jgi:hypothetical protein